MIGLHYQNYASFKACSSAVAAESTNNVSTPTVSSVKPWALYGAIFSTLTPNIPKLSIMLITYVFNAFNCALHS